MVGFIDVIICHFKCMSNCWPPDTLRFRNGTFNSTEDERSQLEDRIEGITRNETSDAITEDDGEVFFLSPTSLSASPHDLPSQEVLRYKLWSGASTVSLSAK